MTVPPEPADAPEAAPPAPKFARSMGLLWLYTLLRFGLFGLLWLILWAVGFGTLIAAAIALVLSIPLSWFLLARPRQALAANLEDRVSAATQRRAALSDRLEGDDDGIDADPVDPADAADSADAAGMAAAPDPARAKAKGRRVVAPRNDQPDRPTDDA